VARRDAPSPALGPNDVISTDSPVATKIPAMTRSISIPRSGGSTRHLVIHHGPSPPTVTGAIRKNRIDPNIAVVRAICSPAVCVQPRLGNRLASHSFLNPMSRCGPVRWMPLCEVVYRGRRGEPAAVAPNGGLRFRGSPVSADDQKCLCVPRQARSADQEISPHRRCPKQV